MFLKYYSPITTQDRTSALIYRWQNFGLQLLRVVNNYLQEAKVLNENVIMCNGGWIKLYQEFAAITSAPDWLRGSHTAA